MASSHVMSLFARVVVVVWTHMQKRNMSLCGDSTEHEQKRKMHEEELEFRSAGMHKCTTAGIGIKLPGWSPKPSSVSTRQHGCLV